MAGQQRRVLVVDDEPMVVEVLQRYLQRDGFTVHTARDGADALREAQRQPPDLVILDLMLPAVDGLEVCRTLRRSSQVPILMLTARSDEADKIRGLGLGADDYVVKPFSPNELMARVKALLRRASLEPTVVSGEGLRFPGLSVDPERRLVEREGKRVELAAREFDLLLYLAKHPRRVFTRDQLLDAVWDYGFDGDASTVTVHVRRLREKIERDPSNPSYVKTVWGVGYKFEPGAS